MSDGKRVGLVALFVVLVAAPVAAAPLLDPNLFLTPEEQEARAERMRQEELRELRRKEFRALVKRAAAGDREAIVELRGSLLVALFEPGPGATELGMTVMRVLLDELARLEGCTR